MSIQAMIFDVDGTLLDTNVQHVEVWATALASRGYDVSKERIGAEVGKGGDKLVKDLLGDAAEAKDGDALRKAHTREFIKLVKSQPVAVFDSVRELFAELQARGVRTLIATSSKEDELKATQASAGLGLRSLVDEIVTADDAERAKPAPDLVMVAVEKSGVDIELCVMVGDTPYDIEAARAAGVLCIGLTCGRYADVDRLRRAGAAMVYDGPADLLAHLDEALVINRLAE